MNGRLELLGKEFGIAVAAAFSGDDAQQAVDRMADHGIPNPGNRLILLLALGSTALRALRACGFDIWQRSRPINRVYSDRWQDKTVW